MREQLYQEKEMILRIQKSSVIINGTLCKQMMMFSKEDAYNDAEEAKIKFSELGKKMHLWTI